MNIDLHVGSLDGLLFRVEVGMLGGLWLMVYIDGLDGLYLDCVVVGLLLLHDLSVVVIAAAEESHNGFSEAESNED